MADAPRIGFAGTPEFALPALQGLIDVAAVPFVLTQPDRPAGRGRRARPSPVKVLAEQAGIRVHQPASLREPELPGALGDAPDLLVVVAYGLLLPKRFLHWPTRGAVNVHASLLPRWRGAAPIQRAMIAGDTVTGVSIMQMERGLDSGPVYGRESVAINPGTTAGALSEQLAGMGAELLLRLLPAILSGELTPERQDDTLMTLAPKLAKAEAWLDWREDAALLARKVCAFNPWPIAETRAGSLRLRIHAAEALDSTVTAPMGTVQTTSAAGIDVATADGVLRLTRVQPSGGRAMSAAAYLNARDLAGLRFELPPV